MPDDAEEASPRSRPQAAALGPGDTIGDKYKIVRPLGRGGNGAVYLARHLELGGDVAVKLLHSELLDRPDNVRRFRREARAAFHLHHENIVRVLDFGEQPAPHIVMEYAAGTTLRRHLSLNDEPPSLELVAELSDQILAALEAAHSQGVVHRDLKPDNVILARDASGERRAKVVDFGLARFLDEADEGPTLTRDGMVAGTPAYMSPEQCRSLHVGPSSDLYAFGCVLTELLQLRTPFADDASAVVLSQHMFMPPPSLKRPADAEPISPALERLRLDLLAKHPHQRPQSAGEVRAALRSAFTGLVFHGRLQRGSRSLPPEHSSSPPRMAADAVGLAVHSPGGDELGSLCLTGLSVQGIAVCSAADAQVRLLIDDRPLEGVLDELSKLVGDAAARPVIVVTAHGANDLPRLLECGAADVLQPPLTPDRLASSVLRAFRRSRPPG